MFVDSVVAGPDFTTCTVQVIGPSDELIHDTFKQIEESFNTNGITDEVWIIGLYCQKIIYYSNE